MSFEDLDTSRVPSPCYVIDERRLEDNLRILQDISASSGANILGSLKAFSMWRLAPLVSRYLVGASAAGAWQARLASEEYGGEIHVYSPAFSRHEVDYLLGIADYLVFNSVSQWKRFRATSIEALGRRPQLRFGLRINPEQSVVDYGIYDPCAPRSRLGVTREALGDADLDGISGLHFHALCEQGLGPLEAMLATVEEGFGDLLANLDWLNLGGGHLLTSEDYDRKGLAELLREFSARHDLRLYLEPGAAVAWDCGALVTEVRDVAWNDGPQVIVDVAPSCHMPDVLEMPYRPDILGAGAAGEKPWDCRVGGITCLAGDVLGDYSFERPLEVGDRLVVLDMAHYTMVRTSSFNGLPLPAIATWNPDSDELTIVREFGYEDFKSRLS